MNLNNDDYHARNLHDQCRQHMYHDVILTMNDGSSFTGIIDDVGTDRMSVLVSEDVMERENDDEADTRQYFGEFGRPRRRFRRYRRRNFPLASLAALALLPYVAPPFYPYYPYPYY